MREGARAPSSQGRRLRRPWTPPDFRKHVKCPTYHPCLYQAKKANNPTKQNIRDGRRPRPNDSCAGSRGLGRNANPHAGATFEQFFCLIVTSLQTETPAGFTSRGCCPQARGGAAGRFRIAGPEAAATPSPLPPPALDGPDCHPQQPLPNAHSCCGRCRHRPLHPPATRSWRPCLRKDNGEKGRVGGAGRGAGVRSSVTEISGGSEKSLFWGVFEADVQPPTSSWGQPS